MSQSLKIATLIGSLRQESLNRRLVDAARALAPADVQLEELPIRTLPHYDADLDGEDAPGAVRDLKRAIAEADGLLIATPEYNYGIPGVLKNAIDWASRPAYRSVLRDKPVAIVGASASPVGTARAQSQLKQVLMGTASLVFPYPELAVGSAREKFDRQGQLVEPATRDRLGGMLRDYAAFLRRVGLAA